MSVAFQPRLRLASGGRSAEANETPAPAEAAEIPEGGRKPISPARDLRLKILSLLLLSALGPVLLVGTASYFTARSIMTDKIASELDIQATWAAERVSSFFEDRVSDADVFSGALIVAENLEAWEWADHVGDRVTTAAAQAKLSQYLAQIGDRYPLYESLIIVDRQGVPVATTTAAVKAGAMAIAEQVLSASRDTILLSNDEGPLFGTRRPVFGSEGARLGSLIAVCRLDLLWLELVRGQRAASDRLRVLDGDGALLFDSRAAEAGAAAGEGPAGPTWELLRRQAPSEYRSDGGRLVLGALRFVGTSTAAILVEIDRASAFAAIYRLRDFTLLVSVLATLLVAAIGFALVINLTRPIEALIEGAKAAAKGDLSHEIPVNSNDQIGYLTSVFNRMIRTVRDSRARLEMLSSTDELTGLLNRRDLAGRFEVELNRASRLDDPLSVLMIDFDRFKAFNDRYGHLEGDAVLRLLGDFLSQCLRSIDVAARYGGEEFLVLLPSTDRASATELAERLRQSFKKVYRATAEIDAEVTLSVGVAAFPGDGTTAADLIGAADGALYAAKRLGRDRVEVAGEIGLKAVAPAGRGSRP